MLKTKQIKRAKTELGPNVKVYEPFMASSHMLRSHPIRPEKQKSNERRKNPRTIGFLERLLR